MTVSTATAAASQQRVFSRCARPENIEYEVLSGHPYRVFERQASHAPLVRVASKEMFADLTDEKRRLVLFGEEHGHPLCHRLEQDLYAAWLRARGAQDRVSISLEMLSRERRPAVRRYLTKGSREREGGACHERNSSARATSATVPTPTDPHKHEGSSEEETVFGGEWHNWLDYAPLVKLARSNGQAVICSNAPRRLTRIVAKGGEPALLAHLEAQGGSASDTDLISPLPLRRPSPEVRAAIGPIFETFRGKRDPARRDRMLLAQTLWDSTMAFSIARWVGCAYSVCVRWRELGACCVVVE